MRVFILLGCATLAACGPGHDKAREGSNVSTVGDETPPVAAGETRPPLPSQPPAPISVTMPDFAPQYPGSTVGAVNNSPSGDGAHEVTLKTQDNAARIADFCRAKFAAAGLEKTSDFLSGGTGVIAAAGKGRRASIAIAKEDDHNAVIVTFSGE